MKKRHTTSCTTILVGKDASIDGSTMVARNEDGHEAVGPKRFIVVNPEDQPRKYKAVISGMELDLPDNPLRYTAMPNAVLDQGQWAEAGINEKNVTMSATETITTNSRVLAVDPYVETGLGEEDLITIVLPYINTAKEGVERLGKLLEEVGTYEPNGIAFSDKDEIWWFETIGGHHWAAVKIPDDAYVVAPNRWNITDFDFNSNDCMCSKDLEKMIKDNFMNPAKDGKINLRHIFGSASNKDHYYNNPRTWYIQRYFAPDRVQDPMDDNLPFIDYANKKIAPEDIKFCLSSHYQDTQWDPYGTMNTAAEKRLFRPVGINRNHSAHILQIRNNVPEEIAALQWVGFGPNTFNAFVPFYTNVTTTPIHYEGATGKMDLNNMYWLNVTIALLGDYNFDMYKDFENAFEQNATAAFRARIAAADKKAKKAKDIHKFLEGVNAEQSQDSHDRSVELLQEMVTEGSLHMHLRYSLGD